MSLETEAQFLFSTNEINFKTALKSYNDALTIRQDGKAKKSDKLKKLDK